MSWKYSFFLHFHRTAVWLPNCDLCSQQPHCSCTIGTEEVPRAQPVCFKKSTNSDNLCPRHCISRSLVLETPMASRPSCCPICLDLAEPTIHPGPLSTWRDPSGVALRIKSALYVLISLPAPLRSSLCPRSSSLLGWCCHSAIILFSLCFLRFLSSVFEVGQDTRVPIFSCCTKRACKKLFPSRTCSLSSPVAGKEFGDQELSSSRPHAEFCPGQSKASSDHGMELCHSRPVNKSRLQGR